MDILKNYKTEDINFIEKYQELHARIKVIQTRMELVETDMQNALKDLEDLRELEKQHIKNGKK
jgi:hypothetical protein